MKKLTKTFTFLAVTALLAGCIGNSSEYILYYLNKGFIGHPVTDFFYVYGAPVGKYDQANGAMVYRWTSAEYHRTPDKVRVSNYANSSGEYEVVDTYKGKIERQYCELRIYTDNNDMVRGFDIAVDTPGRWSTSRCSEIFNQLYP